MVRPYGYLRGAILALALSATAVAAPPSSGPTLSKPRGGTLPAPARQPPRAAVQAQPMRIEEVPVTIARRHSGVSKKPKAMRYGWGFLRAIMRAWWR